MTEPTDAEILALIAEKKPTPSLIFLAKDDAKLADLQAAAVAIARAVLAEWGTPAVVGEPVAYLHDDGYWTAAKTDAGRSLNDRLLFAGSPKVAVYTIPQPTQAQAGAVPLTEEQRNAIYDKHCFLGDNGWEINWWQVIDEVEAAHGIKGGQHGADTRSD